VPGEGPGIAKRAHVARLAVRPGANPGAVLA
jgi:hypothetical protein